MPPDIIGGASGMPPPILLINEVEVPSLLEFKLVMLTLGLAL
jgi:hypothetical protein